MGRTSGCGSGYERQQVGPGTKNRKTYQGIPLPDLTGNGVTTAQVIAALKACLANPVISNKLRADAARANADAVAYVQKFPPNGTAGRWSKSFYFGFQDRNHNWSFDVENLAGYNLRV